MSIGAHAGTADGISEAAVPAQLSSRQADKTEALSTPVRIAAAEAASAEDKAAAAAKARAAKSTYAEAAWDPIHFKPAIDTATDAECLACHQEILERTVLPQSPAGVKAQDSIAWYQTLDTYAGDQMTFHQRHIASDYAKTVMNLSCNFCHQGNDPREESPHVTVAAADLASNNGSSPFTLRKMVNPTETCLRCHGAMPNPEEIMTLPGAWPEIRADMESEDTPNGCLTCHEELYRTVRHQVTYLNAEAIEEAARSSSDVCYGCHGGRQWYRISYPYPRHPWPDMDPETPEWAADRPTESDPRYQKKQ
ncbi:MAG: hypothetical protein KDJ16_16405 [Hyphomicrobiales bacterium]|nr:hypothetical protein [Hyphomicrobiales bacterium]